MALYVASKSLLWALLLKNNASPAICTVVFQIVFGRRLLSRGKLLKAKSLNNVPMSFGTVVQWLMEGGVYPGGEWFFNFEYNHVGCFSGISQHYT